jgi:hypothetical protein
LLATCPLPDTLALTACAFDHNQAQGGNGGWGGAISMPGGSLSDTGGTLGKNLALGGSAGSGRVGGNGLGGGLHVAAGSAAPLASTAVTGNHANGTDGGSGVGGGVYNLGSLTVDPATVIAANYASTGDDDIFTT